MAFFQGKELLTPYTMAHDPIVEKHIIGIEALRDVLCLYVMCWKKLSTRLFTSGFGNVIFAFFIFYIAGYIMYSTFSVTMVNVVMSKFIYRWQISYLGIAIDIISSYPNVTKIMQIDMGIAGALWFTAIYIGGSLYLAYIMAISRYDEQPHEFYANGISLIRTLNYPFFMPDIPLYGEELYVQKLRYFRDFINPLNEESFARDGLNIKFELGGTKDAIENTKLSYISHDSNILWIQKKLNRESVVRRKI